MSSVASWSRTDGEDEGVVLTSLTPLTSPDEAEEASGSPLNAAQCIIKTKGPWSTNVDVTCIVIV